MAKPTFTQANIMTVTKNGRSIYPARDADQRNLIRFFKRLLKRAGLPDIRFHDLRHTAAKLMLLNGIPLIVVSRRLGHSKPSVTLDIYGHYIPGMQQEAAAMMDELVTPIATKWQQIGNSYETTPLEIANKPQYMCSK